MKVRKIYRALYKKIAGTLNPIKYAKKIGVNMSNSVHIYGRVDWSTEPWIISLAKMYI